MAAGSGHLSPSHPSVSPVQHIVVGMPERRLREANIASRGRIQMRPLEALPPDGLTLQQLSGKITWEACLGVFDYADSMQGLCTHSRKSTCEQTYDWALLIEDSGRVA